MKRALLLLQTSLEKDLAGRFDRRWRGRVAVKTSRFLFTDHKVVTRGLHFLLILILNVYVVYLNQIIPEPVSKL
ncbi:hypothetical protein N665_0292s0033 [Sinapis alba]|nr:hypothetical protein N665_0292s0033 [Sinapis alba]